MHRSRSPNPPVGATCWLTCHALDHVSVRCHVLSGESFGTVPHDNDVDGDDDDEDDEDDDGDDDDDDDDDDVDDEGLFRQKLAAVA